MKRVTVRKGSALLIVLGMLSFMVVSAVGFAVYMRQSRLPSSHLRRVASSRYLLRAALANAVARLDGAAASANGGIRCEGVYDDPYPGVSVESLADADNGDLWTQRVFTPFGLVDPSETVSTLTLEALAYLPPAVINEARVYSRQTRTAVWKNLSYDMGRYAFTAVDVSDCFDLNKMLASERRSSAANARVNFSSLIPDGEAAAFDTILERCGDIPFVSLADFNVVAGASDYSPFSKFISSGSDPSIYREDEHVKNALFITDTWFPPTNATATVDASTQIDLAGEPRPFKSFDAKNIFEADAARDDKLYDLLLKNLGAVGVMACLYDYLDPDSKPLSLAMPTVETQPMIASLSVVSENTEETLEVAKTDTSTTVNELVENGETFNLTRTITKHELKVPRRSLIVSGAAVFPFKRVTSERSKGPWKVKTLVAFFFGADTLKSRVEDASLLPPKKEWWSSVPSVETTEGVIWGTGETQISFDENIDTSEKAVTDYQINVSLPETKFPLYYDVVEKKLSYSNVGTTIETEILNKKTVDGTEADAKLYLYDENGLGQSFREKASSAYNEKVFITEEELKVNHGESSQNWTELADETEFRPYVAVWVRVEDKDGDTVDLVPASLADDDDWLGAGYADLKSELEPFSGRNRPLMSFKYDPSLSMKTLADETERQTLLEGADVGKPTSWLSLYTVDPRFNYAPEDWFGTEDADASVANWKTHIGLSSGSKVLGQDGRDSDIFMATSDQGYLQSIGELSLFPALQSMTGTLNDPLSGDFAGVSRYHGRNDFSSRSVESLGDFANGAFFWRTYSSFDRGDGVDPIYELSDGTKAYNVFSGQRDFRVNPYSPDSRVLKAAFKDTPYDWFVASTNETTNPTASLQTSDRAKWAFCESSAVAQLNDSELEEIIETFQSAMREKARGGKPWETAFEGLAWKSDGVGDDAKKTFLGVELENPLHDVDRKYLYSFWRECFQNRQQLFLVFLRAEPLTVGGSGANALGTAQLGARGVALVWRDPKPPMRGCSTSVAERPTRSNLTSLDAWKNYYETYAPHRTRVLFYHPFD